MSNISEVTFADLKDAVSGPAVAFRAHTRLQPAGGAGTKVFPPTYAGGVYATEKRRIPGREEPVDCVLLDSAQSQANRLELALQDAIDGGRLKMPLLTVDFSDAKGLPDPIERVTVLQAPHRVADAILRDSEVADGKEKGTAFRDSELGKKITSAHSGYATPLFETCPTALLLGMWDSTGPKGGLGTKFQRAIVCEMVGVGVETGKKTGSRIDPLKIEKIADKIYKGKDGEWTLDQNQAQLKNKQPALYGKEGKPSEINHGNVTPSIADGGITMDYAEQTFVLSLPAIRRLRFAVEAGKPSTPARDQSAQTVLVALGLLAYALASEQGWDLRSRCLLWPDQELILEILGTPGKPPKQVKLTAKGAQEMLAEAVKAARTTGLVWEEKPVVLKPQAKLVELVKKSQEKSVEASAEEGAN